MNKTIFFSLIIFLLCSSCKQNLQNSNTALNPIQNIISGFNKDANFSYNLNGKKYLDMLDINGACQKINNNGELASIVNSINAITSAKVEPEDKAINQQYINVALRYMFDDESLNLSKTISDRIDQISLYLAYGELNKSGELSRYFNKSDKDQLIISKSQFTKRDLMMSLDNSLLNCANNPKKMYYLALYASNPGSNNYNAINSLNQFNNVFDQNFPKFVVIKNNQGNKFSLGTQTNLIDPKISSLYAFMFTDYSNLLNTNLFTISNKLITYSNQNISTQEAIFAKNESDRQARRALKEKQDKEAKAALDAKLAAEKLERDKLFFGDEKFNRSPSGKLVGAYQTFQLLNTCYESRKDHVFQYVTLAEFEDYTDKIKKIESVILKENSSIDTKDLWSKAVNNNRKGKFRYDIVSEFNLLLVGDLIDLIKYDKSIGEWNANGICKECKSIFSNFEKNILGAEEIQKTF